MFSRPSNLYVVLGWPADVPLRNSMMMEKGAQARERGITLAITDDGKNAFVGKHLGTVDIRDGEAFAGVEVPTPEEEKALEEAARAVDLGVAGRPRLFVVAG